MESGESELSDAAGDIPRKGEPILLDEGVDSEPWELHEFGLSVSWR